MKAVQKYLGIGLARCGGSTPKYAAAAGLPVSSVYRWLDGEVPKLEHAVVIFEFANGDLNELSDSLNPDTRTLAAVLEIKQQLSGGLAVVPRPVFDAEEARSMIEPKETKAGVKDGKRTIRKVSS